MTTLNSWALYGRLGNARPARPVLVALPDGELAEVRTVTHTRDAVVIETHPRPTTPESEPGEPRPANGSTRAQFERIGAAGRTWRESQVKVRAERGETAWVRVPPHVTGLIAEQLRHQVVYIQSLSAPLPCPDPGPSRPLSAFDVLHSVADAWVKLNDPDAAVVVSLPDVGVARVVGVDVAEGPGGKPMLEITVGPSVAV